MQKRRVKKIRLVILIAFIGIITALIKNNGSLIKTPNKQFASVGYTTQIGNKTYSIANQIENEITPSIAAGMIPLKEEGDYWVIADKTDDTWCSYANGKPAYMMLNDGKYQSEEYYKMPDTQEVAKPGTQINKASADLGSIYMYIPRYAYNEAGEIIYIRQNASVAGSWTIPSIFTYKTEKENYALAGIWVECKSNETEESLTSKIEQMNTKDSQYGFISNTKTAIMTEDEQDAIQIFVENLNESVGASIARPLIDNITNPNRSVIHIISTNILEPIQETAVLNDEEERIEISIKYSAFEIDKVLDGEGNELTLNNGKYVQSKEDIASPYVIRDINGNLKEVEFDNLIFISNVEQLCKFRDKVNGGKDYAGYTVMQIKDIDMSSVCGENIGSWEPIGTGDTYFAGTYDGQYHMINGLYMKSDKYLDLGMFTQIGNYAIIQNLIMEDEYIENNCMDNSRRHTASGGIVGTNKGRIIKCGIESGNIKVIKNSNNYSAGISCSGGISGYNDSVGKIDNCYNRAKIYSEVPNQYQAHAMAAGISGWSMNLSGKIITNCYNTGEISTKYATYSWVSGIAGEIYGCSNASINNCYNIGNLIPLNYATLFKGEIAGRIESCREFSIKNCYCLNNYNNYGIQVDSDTLKTYATDEYLGSAYLSDEYNINEGYPILEWELKAKKIVAKAYVNADEGKIVVEIPFHKYNIVKVLNENGEELSKISNTVFKENMTSGNHVYTIIDNEGNEKKVNLNIRLVNSAESLNAFRDEVNNGNSFAGVTVYQTADIDMSSVCGEDIGSWEPIGATDTYFAGTYDGGYHTIENLYINSNRYFDLGMFTQTARSSVIKKLILENVNIKSTYNSENKTDINGNYYTGCGGFVGYGFGLIEQCGIESGNIEIVNEFRYFGTWKGGMLGGIVGRNSGTVNECYNKAKIYQQNKNENYNAAMTGGITGTAISNSVITNCYNTGNISSSSYYIVNGGMIGDKWTYGGIVVKNSYNTGDLSSATYRGGILARHEGNSLTITNDYCLNYATNGATQVNSETLKTYATTLGDAYITDEYNINEGYPILEWELKAKKIIGKAYVNADEGKIVVEITYHKYPISSIAKIVNGIEIPIVMFNETTCKDTLSDGTHTYVVTDSEGNKIQLKVGPIKVLDSANDLCAFRDEVNNGNSFAGVSVYQTADIDLSSICGEGIGSWTPIGANGTEFAGTYDGQYHTISNLYIKTDEYVDLGLFTQITNSATIKNLIMTDIYVENKSIESTLLGSKKESFNAYYSSVGGIVGKNNGKIQQCGIESGNVKYIKDSLKYSPTIVCAGGICGKILEKGKIDSCYNKAKIYTSLPNQSNSQARSAGICGEIMNVTNNVNISNCYNIGELTSLNATYTFAGGIIGDIYSSSNVNVANCYNIGKIKEARYAIGGIAARVWRSDSISINKSYCLESANNGATQVSSETLKTYATDEYLGDAYTNDDGRNNGYPILKWEKEVR